MFVSGRASMSNEWITSLQEHVENKPCLVISFDDDEWERLLEQFQNSSSPFSVSAGGEEIRTLLGGGGVEQLADGGGQAFEGPFAQPF